MSVSYRLLTTPRSSTPDGNQHTNGNFAGALEHRDQRQYCFPAVTCRWTIPGEGATSNSSVNRAIHCRVVEYRYRLLHIQQWW